MFGEGRIGFALWGSGDKDVCLRESATSILALGSRILVTSQSVSTQYWRRSPLRSRQNRNRRKNNHRRRGSSLHRKPRHLCRRLPPRYRADHRGKWRLDRNRRHSSSRRPHWGRSGGRCHGCSIAGCPTWSAGRRQSCSRSQDWQAFPPTGWPFGVSFSRCRKLNPASPRSPFAHA